MMNLVSRCSVRDPNVLVSTASESPEKTKSESQKVPLSSSNVQQTSTGRPVLGASSSNHPEWNIDEKWSSLEWKSDEMLEARTERPVDDKFVMDDDMDSWTIFKRCNARQQQTFFNVSSTLEASVFMGKYYSENLHSIKNTGNNLTMKIVGQSDEIYGVTPIYWEDSSWKQLSLVSDEEVISLSHAKVYVFPDSVLCLGKMNQNPTSNSAWEEK